MKKLTIKRRKLFIFVLCFLLLFSAELIYSNSEIEIAQYEYKSADVPKGFDGCKLVQISDYHNEWGILYNDRLLKAVKAQEPDYIFLTGDTVDSIFTDVEQSVEFAQKLVEIAPVYYIDGNHEYGITEEQRNEFWSGIENCGVSVLNNQITTLRKNGDEIKLIGAYGTNYDMTEKDGFTIMLNHFPEDADYYSKSDNSPDLIFSGHAHGGLICIPFILDGLYAPGQSFFPKYTNGEYDVGNEKLIVSRGVGNSGYTLRLFDPFQLVVCTLKSE